MIDRDEIAQQALIALIKNMAPPPSPKWAATQAYCYADAMLAERARDDPPQIGD